VEACTGPFQVAKTRGDGYVLRRTRHPMMKNYMQGGETPLAHQKRDRACNGAKETSGNQN